MALADDFTYERVTAVCIIDEHGETIEFCDLWLIDAVSVGAQGILVQDFLEDTFWDDVSKADVLCELVGHGSIIE